MHQREPGSSTKVGGRSFNLSTGDFSPRKRHRWGWGVKHVLPFLRHRGDTSLAREADGRRLAVAVRLACSPRAYC